MYWTTNTGTGYGCTVTVTIFTDMEPEEVGVKIEQRYGHEIRITAEAIPWFIQSLSSALTYIKNGQQGKT